MDDINNPSDSQIRETRDKLWEMGILHWKLSACQYKMYEFFQGKTEKTVIFNASRRLGKSYLLSIIALERCIKFPNSTVLLIQPQTAMIRKNFNPDFEATLEDCPLELRPTFKSQDNIWEFPNGSKIKIAGTDGQNYDKLRGTQAHLCLVDEAGYCSDLAKIIKSILTPTTLKTRGRIVLSSTTSTEPDHEFNHYLERGEIDGTMIRKTIYDALADEEGTWNQQITREMIADIIASYPEGEASQEFKTEYLCQKVFNSTDSVLPEFTQEIQDECIREIERPPFYDRYVAQDLGFADLTVVLFGYWNYDQGKLVIEDEYVQERGTTSQLAQNIKKKEKELWMNKVTKEMNDPYLRISDNNSQIIYDLQMDYNLFFMATEKHDKMAYMQRLREMISQKQIIIHPRCKTLISHMRSATWDKQKKDFKRSPDKGHYDAVAALLYLSRNIDKTRNPYPNGYRYSQLGRPHEVFKNEYRSTEETNSRYDALRAAIPRPKSSFRKKINK